jgi:peptidoglycan/LPS O-acetylase OafA/YrhL
VSLSNSVSRGVEPVLSKPDPDSAQMPSPGRLQRFARVTSGGKFIPCIDGLRFVAILLVLLYHLNGYVVGKATGFTEQDARASEVFHWFHGANCGVQLFFSISGLILALPFAREAFNGTRVSLKKYYLRRLTRLEPPFLINLMVMTVLLIFVKHLAVADLWRPLIATMTYTHNLVYGELSKINGVTWSLEIEVQFYLTAPFLLRAYFRQTRMRRRFGLICIVFAMMVLKGMLLLEGSLCLQLGLIYALDHFLIGIAFADAYVFDWDEQPKLKWGWDLLFLPCLILMPMLQRYPIGMHGLPILTALLIVAAFRGKRTNVALSKPLITVIGGMCYTIYLYHFGLISLFGRITIPQTAGLQYLPQFVLQATAIAPVTVLCCAFLYRLLERPFMEWRGSALPSISQSCDKPLIR